MALKKRKKVKKAAIKKVKKAPKKTVKKSSSKKKPAKKRTVLKRAPVKKTTKTVKKPVKDEGKLIGLVTHYFPHVRAAVIKLKDTLSAGETIKIKGHTTNFTQAAASIQINRVSIPKAKKGDEIGLQVGSRVRQGDKVFKV